MKMIHRGTALTLAACVCAHSLTQAADFHFDVTFDGIAPTLDVGSTDPAGVELNSDDTFTVDIHTAPGHFWRVDDVYSQFFPLVFTAQPSAERTGDANSSFLLNGTEVLSLDDPGLIQSFAHIGAESWSLPVGLEFDQVVLSYHLFNTAPEEPTDPTTSTLSDESDIFGAFGDADRPFFRHPSISYNAVPEPGTFALAVVGLIGLGVARRRATRLP